MAAPQPQYTPEELNTIAYARDHLPQAQFHSFMKIVDHFGVPTVKPTITQARSKDMYDMWDLWYGFNPVLSEFIERDFTARGSWITRLFPREEFNGTTLKLIQYKFGSEVMDQVPDQAPNPVMESHQEMYEYALDPRGAMFWMQNDFVFSPQGIKVFAGHCRQLERSLDNTLSFDILTELITVGVQEFLRRFQKPYNPDEFVRAAESLVESFAAYQKTTGGAPKIESKAFALLQEQGITPDISIGPATSVRFYTNLDLRKTRYAEGGTEIYDKQINSETHTVHTQERGIEVHESRGFRLPNNVGIRDPFNQIRTIGEFYGAFDESAPNRQPEDYLSVHRDIVIGDANKTTHTLRLLDLVENCLIWDPKDKCLVERIGYPLLQCLYNWDNKYTHSAGDNRYERQFGSKSRKRKLAYQGAGDDDDEDDQGTAGRLREGELTLYDFYKATGLLPKVKAYLNCNKDKQAAKLFRNVFISDPSCAEKIGSVKCKPATADFKKAATEAKEKKGAPKAKKAKKATGEATAVLNKLRNYTTVNEIKKAVEDTAEKDLPGLAAALRYILADETTGIATQMTDDEKDTLARLLRDEFEDDDVTAEVVLSAWAEDPCEAQQGYTWTDDDFREIPMSLDTARNLIRYNLPIPFGFLAFRPHIQFEAGSYLLFPKAGTAVLYTNRTRVELVRNGKARKIGVSLNFDAKTVVLLRQNLAYFPDVMVVNYRGGYGCSIYRAGDNETDSTQHMRQKDIYVMAVPYCWRPSTPYLDITGYVNANCLQTLQQYPDPQYPTADLYSSYWAFPESGDIFSWEAFVDQDFRSNTFCWQGFQQTNIPQDPKYPPVQNIVYGRGHIGAVITPNTFRSFRGQDQTLLEGNFSRKLGDSITAAR